MGSEGEPVKVYVSGVFIQNLREQQDRQTLERKLGKSRAETETVVYVLTRHAMWTN